MIIVFACCYVQAGDKVIVTGPTSYQQSRLGLHNHVTKPCRTNACYDMYSR